MTAPIGGPNRQQRAQNTQQRKARNAALEQKKNNYNKKQNSIMEQTDKAIDNLKKNDRAVLKKGAQAINNKIQGAKVNTARGGDYGKMSSLAVIGDMAKRGAGKVWNGAVEGFRQLGKGAYKVGKPVVKLVQNTFAGTAKVVNHVVGTTKKAVKTVTTKAKQAVNVAKNFVKNGANMIKSGAQKVGNFVSNAWNSFWG